MSSWSTLQECPTGYHPIYRPTVYFIRTTLKFAKRWPNPKRQKAEQRCHARTPPDANG